MDPREWDAYQHAALYDLNRLVRDKIPLGDLRLSVTRRLEYLEKYATDAAYREAAIGPAPVPAPDDAETDVGHPTAAGGAETTYCELTLNANRNQLLKNEDDAERAYSYAIVGPAA